MKLEDIVLKNRDMIFVEHKISNVACLHIVRMPGVSEDGFYQQGVSSGAFRTRELIYFNKGYKKSKIPVRWFSADIWDPIGSVLGQEKSLRKALKDPSYKHEWRSVPIHEHKDVWEFYKCIGYDYKSQKWI